MAGFAQADTTPVLLRVRAAELVKEAEFEPDPAIVIELRALAGRCLEHAAMLERSAASGRGSRGG